VGKRLFWFAVVASMMSPAALRAEPLELPLGDDLSVPVHRYAAADASLPALLWLPTHRGIQPPMHGVADAMASFGIDTWLADLHTGYFIDVGRDSVKQFPDADIAALIREVDRLSGARGVVVMGEDSATRNVLGGIRAAQLDGGPLPVRGAILVSPAVSEPAALPGSAAPWLPAATATNVPVYVFQPGIGTRRWRHDDTLEVLGSGGAMVFNQVLEGVQGGFLQRPEEDLTALDLSTRGDAPWLIGKALDLLARLPVPENPAALAGSQPPARSDGSRYGLKALELPAPSMLELATGGGAQASLAQVEGAAVLVSFWASWCEPCIEELPALGRLHDDYAHRGLEVVTVNVGETPAAVAAVAERFGMARYTQLYDPRGAEMKRWNVYGFPTNFLLGPEGTIRFGSFGAVAWDDPGVRAQLQSLLGGNSG
jgi:thiol-disulfide isomerase/thioredoxin